MDKNTLLWIFLSQIFPVASTELYELYQKFETPEEIIFQIKENNISNLPLKECESVFSSALKCYANDIAEYCVRNNIKVIPLDSEFYPNELLNISDPPILLYCKGNLGCLNTNHSVSIVGARNACAYSLKCAETFSEILAQCKITIVSGFALGIDTAAHNGALKSNGKTISVLGCGINYDYPVNTMIFKEQIAQNGAILSEYPPLEPPKPINFKVRNRIISGLSQAVLVVEASKKSGSLNTASHALNQGKDVYVIPPRDIFNKRFEGQISLLKDGAETVCSPEDLMINLINIF